MARILINLPANEHGSTYYRQSLPMLNCFSDLMKEQIELVPGYAIDDEEIGLYSAIVVGASDFLDPGCMNWLREFKKLGRGQICWNIDDHVWDCHPSNPVYTLWKEKSDDLEEMSRMADFYICSTPELLKSVPTYTGNEKKMVAENLIDLNRYFPPTWGNAGHQRIVFAGSYSHELDLMMMEKELDQILDEFNVQIHFLGFFPTHFAKFIRHPGDDHGSMVPNRNGIFWQKGVHTKYYPTALCTIAPDILICPLIDHPFNRCKSANKAWEGTLAGAVVVASDVGPYRNTSNILVKRQRGLWYQTLKEVLGWSIEQRKEQWHKQLDEVALNHSWLNEEKKERWKNAFRALVSPTMVGAIEEIK